MPVIFPDSLKGHTLWRYMSLEKLLAGLQTSSLYFPRLGSFKDPYEGSIPIAWQSPVYDLSQLPDLISGDEQFPEWQEMRLNFSEGDHLKDKKLRDELYVSCWHNDPAESAAMWSLYSTKESGIAIKTTSDRLSDALQNCQRKRPLDRRK